MSRAIGYLIAVILVGALLRQLPIVGHLFGGLLGFYLTLLVVGAASAFLLERWRRRQKLASDLRNLAAVDSAHNRGKRGALLLAQGRAREALEPLEQAQREEPQRAEWAYRLAQAHQQLKQPAEALRLLEHVAGLDPEHGYGSVPLGRAEALLALARPAEALAVLRDYERGYGPSPHSALLGARAHRQLGEREQAQARLGEIGQLYGRLPAFQRKAQRPHLWAAWLDRLRSLS
jgi:tetratricopeptide (TPR) repeat protein